MNDQDFVVASRSMSAEVAGAQLQSACHHAAYTAGWWQDVRSGQNLRDEVRANTRFGKALVAEKLALIHSEISEAMEGARKSLPDDKLPHRPMIEVELADAVIRIADLAGALGLDLGGAIAEKLAYNAHRPDHKPEARAAAGGKAY
jgi:NTP pyrophosphatase (non-canonical NTP hydrolase)